MSFVVTGTDTGVGKTVVAALALARFAPSRKLGYWKPVATGAADDRDTATIEGLVPSEVRILGEAYLFAEPVSPHLAARREGREIDLASIVGAFAAARAEDPDRHWVVEGAGGLLVPLDDAGTMWIDLLSALQLPALVVARSSLGTINHTLLALEALRARRLPIAGVALDGPHESENRRAIERFGGVGVVAEVAPFEIGNRAAFAGAVSVFDIAGTLESHLR